ncbi:hypothetical protein KW782_03960 [Candidatus Parcubacteria bacterium]|nr:hypothetical protein [Candidatus Parcubacteria bacterium]
MDLRKKSSVHLLIGAGFALIIAGGIWYAAERDMVIQAQTPEEIALETNSAHYKDADLGFSLYYPKAWEMLASGKKIVFQNVGPGKDRIIITKVSGGSVTDTDSKFGNVTYRYDSSTKKWMKNSGTEAKTEAMPNFGTASNLPVFSGTGRWKTNIIALSSNTFLVINITGSGYTDALDPFTKTVTADKQSINSKELSNALRTLNTQ